MQEAQPRIKASRDHQVDMESENARPEMRMKRHENEPRLTVGCHGSMMSK